MCGNAQIKEMNDVSMHQGAILAYETIKKSIKELQLCGRNERG